MTLPHWLNWMTAGGFALLVLGVFLLMRLVGGILKFVLIVGLLTAGVWLMWHFGQAPQ